MKSVKRLLNIQVMALPLLWAVPVSALMDTDLPALSESSREGIPESQWQMVGVGYKPGTQDIIFYEYHRFELDDDGYIIRRYVEYRLPDDSLKSIKQIDYSNTVPWKPNFKYLDQEVGYKVGVDVTEQQGRLYRYSDKTSLEESLETIYPNTVVDAGFDAYIQHVWPRLMQGEQVGFDFLAPLKLDTYSFALQLKDRQNGVCHIEMALDWWPVSLLIDPVSLEYECDTHRILRYQGITNLRDVSHHQMDADIHYQWNSEYPPFRFN